MTTTAAANGNGTVVEMPAATTALAVRDSGALEPRNLGELRELAADAAGSRFFGATTQQQALLVMMAGKDLGLSYTQALRAFHVIEGKPCLSADGMVATCLGRRDMCEYFRVVEATDTRATVATKRVGDPERTLTFTIEDAQRAKLVRDGSGWTKFPSRMLLARAKSFLAREVYPDLLLGLYDPEEIRDSREEPAPRLVAAEVVTLQKGGPPAPVSEPTSMAQALATQIAQASTPAELDAVVQAISEANISESDKAHLRGLYGAKKKAIASKPAKATPKAAAPAEREPGQEG